MSLISNKQDTSRNKQAKGNSSSKAPSKSNNKTQAHIKRIGQENFKGSWYNLEAQLTNVVYLEEDIVVR